MSIRRYIFGLLTGLVLFIAAILSMQSARMFLTSFDMAAEGIMREIGEQFPNDGLTEQTVLGYHATTQWSKVPEPVRAHFPTRPQQIGKVHVKFIDWMFISPPNHIYSVMVVNRGSEHIYVSRTSENIHQKIAQHSPKDGWMLDPMVEILLLGVAGLIIFIVVLLTIFKKIALPMESLQRWAKRLTIEELDKPTPNFRFRELNTLASLIHNNLASVADSIKREQDFLGYASHELRTPIAVIRSNAALLEKINPTPSEKERAVRDRMSRASLTMKSMTETLLWLSREGDVEIPLESISLGETISTITQELEYLLAGKGVTVELAIEDLQLMLPLTPTKIVLNNLIRNAFQHTQQGMVIIEQQAHQIVVTNIDESGDEDPLNDTELGFGLGMMLVEKVTTQFGWGYTIENQKNYYRVTINLVDQPSASLS